MKTVGLGGLGAIGSQIALALDEGIPGLTLACVAAASREQGDRITASFRNKPQFVQLADLAQADIVVEALPAAAFDEIALPAVMAGRVFVPCSVAALLARPGLFELARKHGARIVVPTGAIAGLDAVRAIAQGPVDRVLLESRKPPNGFGGVQYLIDNGISVDNVKSAQRVFKGNAGEAGRHFPANANVAAALALAGIGPERTQVEIWADPAINRNIHKITVNAPSANLTILVENAPCPSNPKTSQLAGLSIIATLRSLTADIRIGT